MPFILNAAPINFENATINIEKFTYSEEKLNELHDRCRKSHLIKRSGDQILALPFKTEQPLLGGTLTGIELEKELSLVRSLANHSLYRELQKRDCWISSLNPLSYLMIKKNLLEDCMPSDVKLIRGLNIFAKWEIGFRVIDPTGRQPFISMTINVGTAPRIALNCQQLMINGLSIIGYYVGKAYYGKNPELKPRFSTVGKVVNVNSDGYLELEDVREGQSHLADPSDLYLEPREDLLDICIRHLYRDRAGEILANIENRVSDFHVGDKKLRKIQNALAQYQKFNLFLTENCKFHIGDFLTNEANRAPSLKIEKTEKPTFVFSTGGTKTSYWNDLGLQTYGPFSRETFTPNKPHICVITQSKNKGVVEEILHKFLNGIPPVSYGKGGKSFEFTGLKNKFRLQDCTVDFYITSDDTVDSYNKAISNALQSSGTNRTYDLAFVQIDDNFRNRKVMQNPYLAAKSRFIGQQIPVQEFTLESLGQPNNRIVWSLNNMALATYAKLGGVPWLLPADGTISHEIVFGIGSATIHTSRLGAKERMIGITTVFTGDGRYHVNNISSAVRSEEYFEALLNNLRATIERVKIDFAWRPKDNVRLIFHAFKTFKDTEAEAVKILMSELGDYNVEFAFLHVAPNSPYLLFDTNQKAIYGKGILAPERTTYLQISEHVSLVVLTGPQELKKRTDGLPQPVQLILHRDSTFKDVGYLSKQVVKFGAHSWRSFQPAPMPVSVYYSQLMAQMLSQLSSVDSWNPDAIYNKIGTTRWFL